MEAGWVYWITGLAGAGKTTVGRLFYQRLQAVNKATVFLDGDTLREVYGQDLGYARADRLLVAGRNARLCQMLASQGLDVVCCTISMFDEVRAWNRAHIAHYREIYLKAAPEVLQMRDQKQLYSSRAEQVVGQSLAFEEPKQPDLILENNGLVSPEALVEQLVQAFDLLV